ncbi:MAG: hypothetical protein WC337_08695, partial [Candidatus Muiribacteriota bacterium]
LPILKSPDYSNIPPAVISSAKRISEENYLISNTIFDKNLSESLDQTQFIPENSKIKIKIKKTERNKLKNEIDTELKIDGKTHNFKAKSIGAFFETESFVIAKLKDFENDIKTDEQGDYIIIADRRFTVISSKKIYNGETEYLEVKHDGRIINEEVTNPVLALYSLYFSDEFIGKKVGDVTNWTFSSFLSTCEEIKKAGYTPITDISPTRESVKETIEKYEYFKIFYYDGHGEVESNEGYMFIFNDYNSTIGTYATKPDFKLSSEKLKSWNMKTDLLYLNACNLGEKLEQFRQATGAKAAFGWNSSPHAVITSAFAKESFKLLKDNNLEYSIENARIPAAEFILKNYQKVSNQTPLYSSDIYFKNIKEVFSRYLFFLPEDNDPYYKELKSVFIPIMINKKYILGD